jgi:hypothetical protein
MYEMCEVREMREARLLRSFRCSRSLSRGSYLLTRRSPQVSMRWCPGVASVLCVSFSMSNRLVSRVRNTGLEYAWLGEALNSLLSAMAESWCSRNNARVAWLS